MPDTHFGYPSQNATSTINKILRNEKYIDDALLQKTYTTDFLNKTRVKNTGLECHARTINELDLQEIVVAALNELLGDKSKYQQQLQQNIAKIIRTSVASSVDGIDGKLMELQQELVKKANYKEAYDEISEQIFELREQRQQAAMDTVQRDKQIGSNEKGSSPLDIIR